MTIRKGIKNLFNKETIHPKYGRYILHEECVPASATDPHPKYKIEFLDYPYITHVTISNLKTKNGLYNPFYPSVANIGYIGNASKSINKKIYDIWRHMIGRCYSINNKDYCRYGAKGITVEKRWHCFEYFLEDVKLIDGWSKTLFDEGKITLDKDKKQIHLKEKIYSKEMCTWLSKKENNLYKTAYFRKSKAIDPNGKEYIFYGQALFASQHGLKDKEICAVLNKKQKTHIGWKFEFLE